MDNSLPQEQPQILLTRVSGKDISSPLRLNNDDTSGASSVKMNSRGFHEKGKNKMESDLCLDSY
jgi:hypothetical protein